MTVTSYAARIFGRSPFGPLQEHIGICHRCAAVVQPLLDAAVSRDWVEVERCYEEMVRLEHEADDRKRDIRVKLPRGFFLPVARPDLLNLLTSQDKIANRAKDIGGLVLGRKLAFPDALRDQLRGFAEIAIATCGRAKDLVRELDELLDTGFRGAEVTRVRGMINDLDLAERSCDEHEVQIRAQLYTLERDLGAVDVMFMYRVIEWVGDLADSAQQVGHRLELMLAG